MATQFQLHRIEKQNEPWMFPFYKEFPTPIREVAALNSQFSTLVCIKITIFLDVARYTLIINAYITKKPDVSIFFREFPKYGESTFHRNGSILVHLPKLHRTTSQKSSAIVYIL
jgi:hypothetical protein